MVAACLPSAGARRKVRTPQGTMPGNPRAGRPADRATETDRPHASSSMSAYVRGKGEKVV